MKVVVQRVTNASVSINSQLINQIQKGMLVFVAFSDGDTQKEIDLIIKKLLALRIFSDQNGLMNKSLNDINGELLLISQFTLYADVWNGNRPSFGNALASDKANILYDQLVNNLNSQINIKTGVFGADMQVSLINDGPITIIIDTKEKIKDN